MNASTPSWDWPRDATGEILVGGQPLTRVVNAVGSTPCYLYDRQRLADRARALRAALPKAVLLHYAMKANPMPALVGHMARLVDGLDVASAGELRVALDTGMAPEHISFAGPGKSDGELQQAVAAGILVNVESFREIKVLAEASQRNGVPARVAVRVNLPFELKASGMKMSGGARQFGVDAECVPDLLRDIAGAGLAFEGFHMFAGSQNLRHAAIVEAQTKEIEFLTIFRYANVYDRAIKYIASGQINVKPLITHRYDFDDALKAFEYAATMPGDAIKIMIKLPD